MATKGPKSSPRSPVEGASTLRSDVQIAKRMAQTRNPDACSNSEGRIWHYGRDYITLDFTWQAVPEDALRREVATYDSDDARLNKGRIDSILACFGDQLGDQPDFFAQRVLGINCADHLR